MNTLQEWDFEKYAQSAAKKALNHNIKHVMKEGGRAGKALVVKTNELISTVQVLGAAGGAAKAAQAISVTTGVMSALFLALDVFFLAKDSHELRKGAKTKFAKKIREVCKDLQDGLLELNKVKSQLQKTMEGIELEQVEEILEVEEEVEEEEAAAAEEAELASDPAKLAKLYEELDVMEEKLDKRVQEERERKEKEERERKEKEERDRKEKEEREKQEKEKREKEKQEKEKKEKQVKKVQEGEKDKEQEVPAVEGKGAEEKGAEDDKSGEKEGGSGGGRRDENKRSGNKPPSQQGPQAESIKSVKPIVTGGKQAKEAENRAVSLRQHAAGGDRVETADAGEATTEDHGKAKREKEKGSWSWLGGPTKSEGQKEGTEDTLSTAPKEGRAERHSSSSRHSSGSSSSGRSERDRTTGDHGAKAAEGHRQWSRRDGSKLQDYEPAAGRRASERESERTEAEARRRESERSREGSTASGDPLPAPRTQRHSALDLDMGGGDGGGSRRERQASRTKSQRSAEGGARREAEGEVTRGGSTREPARQGSRSRANVALSDGLDI
ncbi:hypothetical protein CRUP_007221 [Coryphaenoides rupestris]|nr:hypothetical protein CRUP_007221 [Coryphaenoides rupestris]